MTLAPAAQAQDVPAKPTYTGDTGLFHLSSAYTLPKGKVSVSLFRDNLDRDPKDVDISIHGVSLGFGLSNRVELFGNFGLQNRVNSDALFQPGFVNDYPFVGNIANSPGWQTGGGDIKVGVKFKLLDDYMGDGVGLALRGFLKLGTADAAKGLGTGKASAGVQLLLSKSLGGAADIHGSIGYQVNSDPDAPRSADIGNALKWGVGINIPARRRFQIQAEVTGASYKGADFKQTNPVDFVAGPVIRLGRGFFIRLAISKNLNFDDGGLNSSYKSYTGRQISLGYHAGRGPRRQGISKLDVPPRVTCKVEAERKRIRAGDKVQLFARDTDPSPLKYEWLSDSGCLRPTNGPQATFYACDVTGRVVVTVKVSDQNGRTGHSNCEFDVESPSTIAGPLDVSQPFVLSSYEHKPTDNDLCAPQRILHDLADRISGRCKATVELARDGADALEIRCLTDAASADRYYYLGSIWFERRSDSNYYRLLGLAYAGRTVASVRVVDPTAESEVSGWVAQASAVIRTRLQECGR